MLCVFSKRDCLLYRNVCDHITCTQELLNISITTRIPLNDLKNTNRKTLFFLAPEILENKKKKRSEIETLFEVVRKMGLAM